MLFKYHAGPETDDFPGGDLDLLACLGITAFSRVLFPDHEVSETGKLNGFTLFQCPFD